MKFGSHSYIFTDSWSDDTLNILDEAKNLGLDCFEIGVGDDVLFTSALTRKRAEALELELIISPGGKWPMECDLSSESAEQRSLGLSWHKRQVDLAHELGAKAYTGALYGHTGVVHKHPPLPEEYQSIAEGLYHLADYAAGKGVAVALEPMSHFRTHLVNRPEQALELLRCTNHPNLSVLLDTYHMAVELRDFGAAIRSYGSHLWGLHACENDRGVPGGGIMPWPAIFTALQETGFDGYVILEAYNSSIPGFAYQRGMFHNVCPDGRAFVEQGLRFLKSGLH
jgi:D-psicose/D-tagatose/L-ribulose 3-epimerase